ncbi:MAG: hypothetical protein GWP06_02235 [Actinobacteria bacterium]|nr:hypothetical protein [Actinomycetota bacterium]
MSFQTKSVNSGTEPVTLAEAKAALKVDYSTEDDYITSLITSARAFAERFCNRSLIAKTITYFNDEQSTSYLLPYPEHSAINTVKINDVTTTDFTQTGLVQFSVNLDLVQTLSDFTIEVAYTTTGNLPDGMKPILLKIIADMYENRNNQELSPTAMAQLLPYKVYR